MASAIPALRAQYVATLTIRAFPQGVTPDNLEQVFTTFANVSKENGGHPFAMLPAAEHVPQTSSESAREVIFHASWFRQHDMESAFAAVIFEPATGKCSIVHDFDTDWPDWLNQRLTAITSTIVQAEGRHHAPKTLQ